MLQEEKTGTRVFLWCALIKHFSSGRKEKTVFYARNGIDAVNELLNELDTKPGFFFDEWLDVDEDILINGVLYPKEKVI